MSGTPFLRLRTTFLVLVFYGLAMSWARGQASSPELLTFNAQRLHISQVGMTVLGSWAIGNIGLSALRVGQTTGEDQHFYQMNLYWNAVNLALAGLGFYGATTGKADGLSAFATLKTHYSMEKIFLFNAGLDVGYLMGGLYLLERGNRQEAGKQHDLFRGFGRSIMVQGGFLLLFDGTMFLIHHHHLNGAKAIFDHLTLSGNSVGLVLRF